MPWRYPAEFRRRVVALLEAGGKVADVAADLDVSANTIYVWRNCDVTPAAAIALPIC